MESFQNSIVEYRRQLKKGAVQKAYRGLMEYIMGLRTHFMKAHPDFAVPGSLYYGYMDMTYFPVVPEFLKDRKLKIAIVFLHEEFRFEAWLSGANRQVQQQYWEIIKESGWDKYKVVPQGKGVDSIIESVLARDPDFSDLNALTEQIDKTALEFIRDIERFLTDH